MKNSNGFTLLEVLIVVALAGILSAIAAPFASDHISRSRTNAAARELYADLQGLRRDAMTRASAPSGRGYGIRFFSPTTYELFEFNDVNNNFQYDAGGGEEFAPRQRSFPGNVEASLASGASLPGTVILFDKQGIARNATWGTVGGNNRVVLRKTGNAQGRCIVIALSRIREGTWNGSDCNAF